MKGRSGVAEVAVKGERMGSIFHFPDCQTFGWTLLVLVFLFHCSIAQQLSPPTRHSWQSQSFQPPLSQQREHQHEHQHAYDDLQDYERIVHRSSNEPTRHASSYLEDPRSAAIIAFVLAALILYVEPTIGRFYKSWRQQQRLAAEAGETLRVLREESARRRSAEMNASSEDSSLNESKTNNDEGPSIHDHFEHGFSLVKARNEAISLRDSELNEAPHNSTTRKLNPTVVENKLSQRFDGAFSLGQHRHASTSSSAGSHTVSSSSRNSGSGGGGTAEAFARADAAHAAYEESKAKRESKRAAREAEEAAVGRRTAEAAALMASEQRQRMEAFRHQQTLERRLVRTEQNEAFLEAEGIDRRKRLASDKERVDAAAEAAAEEEEVQRLRRLITDGVPMAHDPSADGAPISTVRVRATWKPSRASSALASTSLTSTIQRKFPASTTNMRGVLCWVLRDHVERLPKAFEISTVHPRRVLATRQDLDHLLQSNDSMATEAMPTLEELGFVPNILLLFTELDESE